MKKTLSFASLCLCPLFLMAQVTFETFKSYDKLLEKAKKEKRHIFIQIESSDCAQCNDVAMTGLGGTMLKEKYATNFISTVIKVGDELYPEIVEKYELTELTGSLFLDREGNVLYKNSSTTSTPIVYIQWADKAIANLDKLADWKSLEKNYQKGDRTAAFLEKYIIAMRGLDKNADAIMEEYIGKMIVDSLSTIKIIKFVLEQGLSLNSPSYKAIYALNPSSKTDSLWFLMPLSKRVNINNRITSRTFAEAIKNKDISLAYRITNFTRGTFNNNYIKGEFAAQTQMLNFYKAIKDTTRYLKEAVRFAHFMTATNMDSFKVWDTREREESFKNREADKRFVLPSIRYATELNNLAWHYYLMTDNPENLAKAMKWSKHSMTIFKENNFSPYNENAAFLDTYAHLLYKMKQFDEAVEWQTKAIEAQKEAKMKTDNFEKELGKMKSRKL